jgi:hypothetical protein
MDASVCFLSRRAIAQKRLVANGGDSGKSEALRAGPMRLSPRLPIAYLDPHFQLLSRISNRNKCTKRTVYNSDGQLSVQKRLVSVGCT